MVNRDGRDDEDSVALVHVGHNCLSEHRLGGGMAVCLETVNVMKS